MYWIDPNGGCSADGFQVHCDYEDGSCATCINANEWVSSITHLLLDSQSKLFLETGLSLPCESRSFRKSIPARQHYIWPKGASINCRTCSVPLQPHPISPQITYNINKVQLKMLQITSRHAEQALTVHCRNFVFEDQELLFHGMKPGSFITPQTFSDGCTVSCHNRKSPTTIMYVALELESADTIS